MKVIDLLNKINNEEEVPEKIMFENIIFKYDKKMKDYIHEEDGKFVESLLFKVMETHLIRELLRTKVEVIEENKHIKEIPKAFKWDSENKIQDDKDEILKRTKEDFELVVSEDIDSITLYKPAIKDVLYLIHIVEKQAKQIERDKELKIRLCRDVNKTYEEAEGAEKKFKKIYKYYTWLANGVNKIAIELGLHEDSEIEDIIKEIRKLNHSDKEKEDSSMYYFNLWKEENEEKKSFKKQVEEQEKKRRHTVKSLKGIIKQKDKIINRLLIEGLDKE